VSRQLSIFAIVKSNKTLIVIGGGAAGFFCAVNAARLNPSLTVIIIERSSKLLQKVKVSGGGRCNVTHACFEISQMVKRYPRGEKFLKKAFHSFFTTDTIKWFEDRGVALKAEADGRMFPVTDSSQTIINCLLHEADRFGIEIVTNFIVEQILPQANGWIIGSKTGRQLAADFLCIACGGFAKVEQFNWILNPTGHTIAGPVPSLFTFNIPRHPITALMGVSVNLVQVKIAGLKLQTEGPILITHWGLSGPAVLKMSAFAVRELASRNYNYVVIINWLPAFNENTLREKILVYRQAKGNQKPANTDWLELPWRLLDFLLAQSGVLPEWRWADIPASAQNKLIKNICAYELSAMGKTTFKDEFVTAGGINLSEVDAATMESRLKTNLYFAGEILDVDGITGGFNFQNAWTTGFVAAKAIAAKPEFE
jgi:predicted Rossmann fold flavoprotein